MYTRALDDHRAGRPPQRAAANWLAPLPLPRGRAGLSAPCRPPTGALLLLSRPAALRWGRAPLRYSSRSALFSHSVLAPSVQGPPARRAVSQHSD